MNKPAFHITDVLNTSKQAVKVETSLVDGQDNTMSFTQGNLMNVTDKALCVSDSFTGAIRNRYNKVKVEGGASVTSRKHGAEFLLTEGTTGTGSLSSRETVPLMVGVESTATFDARFFNTTNNEHTTLRVGAFTKDFGFWFGYVGDTFGVAVRAHGHDTFWGTRTFDEYTTMYRITFSGGNGKVSFEANTGIDSTWETFFQYTMTEDVFEINSLPLRAELEHTSLRPSVGTGMFITGWSAVADSFYERICAQDYIIPITHTLREEKGCFAFLYNSDTLREMENTMSCTLHDVRIWLKDYTDSRAVLVKVWKQRRISENMKVDMEMDVPSNNSSMSSGTYDIHAKSALKELVYVIPTNLGCIASEFNLNIPVYPGEALQFEVVGAPKGTEVEMYLNVEDKF